MRDESVRQRLHFGGMSPLSNGSPSPTTRKGLTTGSLPADVTAVVKTAGLWVPLGLGWMMKPPSCRQAENDKYNIYIYIRGQQSNTRRQGQLKQLAIAPNT